MLEELVQLFHFRRLALRLRGGTACSRLDRRCSGLRIFLLVLLPEPDHVPYLISVGRGTVDFLQQRRSDQTSHLEYLEEHLQQLSD